MNITPFLPKRIMQIDPNSITKVSGSLLLSDISGFTYMCEVLSKFGKAGTEKITHILNDYFGKMIEISNKFDGDILKFGGDALLIAFYGRTDKTNEMALSCARKMMEEVSNFKSVKTEFGEFSINIKCVISTGEWYETIIGNEMRKELFLDGISVRELVKLEDEAEMGNIISSKTNVVYDSKLKKVRNKLDYNSFLLEGLRRYSDEETINEYRGTSIVFINISGYDTEYIDIKKINKIFTEIVKITEKYKGSVGKILPHKVGSNIMLLFGAPVAYGDDIVNAVLCGMEIIKLNLPDIKINIGINTGYVYGGIIGSDLRKEYTVIGDTVNTAERLMETADRMVIVSEETFRNVKVRLELQEIAPVYVKGKEKALRRFIPSRILEDKRYIFTLVGRDYEIEKISEAIRAGSNLVLITGEAGIGKTRLLYELKRKYNSTHKILEGSKYEMKDTFSIFKSMFEKEAMITSDDSDEVKIEKLVKLIKSTKKEELINKIPFISTMLFGLQFPKEFLKNIPPKLMFENLCDGIIYYIESYEQPVLIMFDDIHLMTKEETELIAYITRALLVLSQKKNNFTFILSGRPVSFLKESIQFEKEFKILALEINPLKVDDCERLLYQLLKNKNIPSDIKDILLKKSEGNPFYLEQIALDIIERGFIIEEEKEWRKSPSFKEEEIPINIFTAIMSRIDRLEEKTKEIIRLGSVIGLEFSQELIERITDDIMTLKYLQRAEEEQIVYKNLIGEIEYIFRHAIIKDVVYNSILVERRKYLHNAVGETIESAHNQDLSKFFGILAFHFNHAGKWEKALEYSIKAGNKAKDEYKNEEAINYFKKAIEIIEKELPEKKEKLYEAYTGLGRVYYNLSSLDIARDYFIKALEISEMLNIEKKIDTLNIISETYRHQSNYDEALNYALKALELSREINYAHGEAYALCYIGINNHFKNNFNEAMKFYNEALDLFKKNNEFDGVANVLNNIGGIFYSTGKLDEAEKKFKEVLEIKANIGNKKSILTTLNNIGLIYSYYGKFDEAMNYFEDYKKYSKEIGDKSSYSASLINIANIKYIYGKIKESLTINEEAKVIKELIKDISGLSGVLNNIGLINLDLCDFKKAFFYFNEALDKRLKIGDRKGYSSTLFNISKLYKLQGRFDLSLNYLLKSTEMRKEIGDKIGLNMNFLLMGEIYSLIGFAEESIKMIQNAYNFFKEKSFKEYEIVSLLTLLNSYFNINEFDRTDEILILDDILKKYPKKDLLFHYYITLSRYYEGVKNFDNASNYIEEAFKTISDSEKLIDKVDFYQRFCEFYIRNNIKKDENRLKLCLDELISLGEKMDSILILWKAFYLLYSLKKRKKFLNNAKKNLEKQLFHIPIDYINSFKKKIKDFTYSEIEL